MKIATNIAGILLGLAFTAFGLNFFLNFLPIPDDPSPPNAAHKLFLGALVPSGYLAFVKVLEILGGLLVAIPRTRNLGLLLLGPIVVNILCFHVFLRRGATLLDPAVIGVTILSAFLLARESKRFARLVSRDDVSKGMPSGQQLREEFI